VSSERGPIFSKSFLNFAWPTQSTAQGGAPRRTEAEKMRFEGFLPKSAASPKKSPLRYLHNSRPPRTVTTSPASTK